MPRHDESFVPPRRRYLRCNLVTRAGALASLTIALSCGAEAPLQPDPQAGPPPVASVSVTPSSVTLVSLGEVAQLTAGAADASGNTITGKTASWSTSDPSVATVAGDGTVTAVSNGTATITGTIDGVDGTASVLVEQVVASVLVLPESLTVAAGDEVTYTAAATDALSSLVPAAQFSWTTSDGAVVSIDADGLASTRGVGVASITATSGGVDGEALLVVMPPKPLMVFVGRGANGQDDIYTVQPVSGRTTQVTNDAEFDFGPTWAPDRSEIAFGREQNGQRDIWAIAPDGTGLRRINNDATFDQGPSWSPNGQIIAFEHLVSGNQIWQMTPTGGSLQVLAGPPDHSLAQRPRWFPTGNEIAYEASVASVREIWVMNSDGSNKTQITTSGGAKFLGGVSPDGQTVVFSWRQVSGEQKEDIFRMNRDGSNVQQLTDRTGVSFNAVWSPDGTEIAFWNGSIWIMNADGSNPRPITLDLPLLSAGFFGLDW